jgi:naphthalene 1,2-dioxygenase system ferredoxin subunit
MSLRSSPLGQLAIRANRSADRIRIGRSSVLATTSRPSSPALLELSPALDMSGDETGWVRAAARANLAQGDVLGVEVAGHLIALYDVDGGVFATDNICTHAYARLSDGWLDGELIECPLHAARFDVRTGKVLDPPATEDLKTYPVRIVDDEIQVKLD